MASRRGKEALKKLLPDEPKVFHMKDYSGPDRGLCHEDEVSFKAFVEDATEIGIPRCRARCALDIQQFVREQQLEVPFVNDKPGTNLCKTISMPMHDTELLVDTFILLKYFSERYMYFFRPSLF